jgi:DMSO/TMAO reductase YedYZ molybdopterin-dependent catalytic subunit
MLRRSLLLGTTGVVLAGEARRRGVFGAAATNPVLPAGARDEAILDALPGKQKLIKLSFRPPNYESPLDVFRRPTTPNDEFFVRYHLAVIPDIHQLKQWSLTIDGDAAAKAVRFSLDELKHLPSVELTAVCQCAGNRRGLFDPHVPGVQWGVGAMGNARWRGARLKDMLIAAGIKPDAVEVAFNGTDTGPLDATPIFRKSLPIDRALDESTLIAYEMNGAPLPLWNGFPARLIVPGWVGTYWMKHVSTIDIRTKPLDSFWMAKAYRVPRGMFPAARPFATQDNEKTSPITEIVVNSLVTSPADGASVSADGFDLQGVAWDDGSGIRTVEVSADGGANWAKATLGEDLGRFSFRPFGWRIAKPPPGPLSVTVRATSNAGAVQPAKAPPNPAGYNNNAMQTLTLSVA